MEPSYGDLEFLVLVLGGSGVAQKKGNTPRLHSGNFSFKSDESTPNKYPIEVPVGVVLVLVLLHPPSLYKKTKIPTRLSTFLKIRI